MRAVDIGYEMRPQCGGTEGSQRSSNHQRTQIRSTNADVHDVGERPAGTAPGCTVAHVVCHIAHALENGANLRHHILAINHNWPLRAIAQGRMQHGASFGDIDSPAFKHGRNLGGNAGFVGQIYQQPARLRRHWILRIVEQNPTSFDQESFRALRVLRKQIENGGAAVFARVRIQGFPRGPIGQSHEA